MEEGTLQDAAAVRVAVRVRPLITRELLQGSRQCISTDGPCVTIGRDRRFTFDHAFGPNTTQEHVYQEVVSPLVESCFDGFNVTVLAYGQTGSGKTYTMGTGECRQEEQLGIAPRVVRHLFQGIQARKQQAAFHVRAQFLEIYNEDVKDLLLPPAEQATRWISRESGAAAGGVGAGSGSSITLRDAGDGTIVVIGATEQSADCEEDLLELLERGMAARATSNTFANEQSSRSHAILTIVIEQHVLLGGPDGGSSSGCNSGGGAGNGNGGGSRGGARPHEEPGSGGGPAAAAGEFRTAKLHLVDLAGSERTKQLRSSMQGNGARFRETVNINQGLLALGNVISALGDERRRGSHVPYRESKLTRLLQDSLGGNSRTAMIACVSPADDVLEETLNTLKYANRAKNIRNKPVVNRASSQSSLSPLRGAVLEVQLQVLQQLIEQLPHSGLARGLPLAELRQLHMGDPVACLEVLTRMKSALAACASEGGAAAEPVRRADPLGRPLPGSSGAAAAGGSSGGAAAAAGVGGEEAGEGEEEGEAVSSLVAGCGRAIAGILQGLAEMEAQGHVDREGREHILRSLDASTLQLLPAVRSVGMRRSSSAAQSSAGAPPSSSSSGPASCTRLLPSCLSAALESAAAGAAADADAGGDGPDKGELTQRSGEPSGAAASSREEQVARSVREQELEDRVKSLESELACCRTELREAREDLERDEIIFADKMKELQEARSAAADSQQRLKEEQERHAAEVADLRKQLADLDAQRTQQQPHPQQLSGNALGRLGGALSRLGSRGRNRSHSRPRSGSGSGSMLSARHSEATSSGSRTASGDGDVPPHTSSTTRATATATSAPPTGAGGAGSEGDSEGEGEERGGEEDEVLYDEELLSYISETDYTEQHRREVLESDAALREELAEVLREKAAAEAERAALERSALAQRSSFDSARAALEQQLSQLSANISRQQQQLEAAQAAEREARELAARWQERAQELESAIQAREAALAELRGELAAVEGGAARSGEERAALRRQYEERIAAVVAQVTALQRQLQQHESGGADKRERQATTERAALMEAELGRLRTQQADLRKQLSERISRYERDNAERVKELTALRRAATAARNRMQALEQENRAQRLMLRAKQQEVLSAQQQLRDSQRAAAASGPVLGGAGAGAGQRSGSPGGRGYGSSHLRGYNSMGVAGSGRGLGDAMGGMRGSGQRSFQGAAWNAGPGSRQSSPGPRRATPLRSSVSAGMAALGRMSGILSPLQQRLVEPGGGGYTSPPRLREEQQPPPQQQQAPLPQPLTPEQQQELADWSDQLLAAVAEAASVEARLEVLAARQRELLARRDKVLRDQSQLGLRTQRRAEQLAQAVAACNSELAELVSRIPSPRYDTPTSSTPGTPRGAVAAAANGGGGGGLSAAILAGGQRGGGGFGGSRSLLSDDWVALQQRIADVSHSKAALEERLRSGRLLEEREQQLLDAIDDQLEDLDTQLSYVVGELADHRGSLAQLQRRREQLQQRCGGMSAEGLRLALAAATEAVGKRAFQVRQLEAALAASESGAARREAALQVRLRESLVSISAHLASLEATSPGSSVSLNSAGIRTLLGMYLDGDAGGTAAAPAGPAAGEPAGHEHPPCAASGPQLHVLPPATSAVAGLEPAAAVPAAAAAGTAAEEPLDGGLGNAATAANAMTSAHAPGHAPSGATTAAAAANCSSDGGSSNGASVLGRPGSSGGTMPRVPRLPLPLRSGQQQQHHQVNGNDHQAATASHPCGRTASMLGGVHQETLGNNGPSASSSNVAIPVASQRPEEGLRRVPSKSAVEAFEEGVELSMRALPVKPRMSGLQHRQQQQQPGRSEPAGSSWEQAEPQQEGSLGSEDEEGEEELAILERSCGGGGAGGGSVRSIGSNMSVRSSGGAGGEGLEGLARDSALSAMPPRVQQPPKQHHQPRPACSSGGATPLMHSSGALGAGGILRRSGSIDSLGGSSCSGSYSSGVGLTPVSGSTAKRVTWSAYVGASAGCNAGGTASGSTAAAGPSLASLAQTPMASAGGLGQGGGSNQTGGRGRSGSILDRAAAGLLGHAGRGGGTAACGDAAEGQGGAGSTRSSLVSDDGMPGGEEAGQLGGGCGSWADGVRDSRDSGNRMGMPGSSGPSWHEAGGAPVLVAAAAGSKAAWSTPSVVPTPQQQPMRPLQLQQQQPPQQALSLSRSSFEADDTLAAADAGRASGAGSDCSAATAGPAASAAKTGIRSYNPWSSPDAAKMRRPMGQQQWTSGDGDNDLLLAQDSDPLLRVGAECSLLSVEHSECSEYVQSEGGAAACGGRKHMQPQHPQAMAQQLQQQQQHACSLPAQASGRYGGAARYGGDSCDDGVVLSMQSACGSGALRTSLVSSSRSCMCEGEGEQEHVDGGGEDDLEEQLRLLERAVATANHQQPRQLNQQQHPNPHHLQSDAAPAGSSQLGNGGGGGYAGSCAAAAAAVIAATAPPTVVRSSGTLGDLLAQAAAAQDSPEHTTNTDEVVTGLEELEAAAALPASLLLLGTAAAGGAPASQHLRPSGSSRTHLDALATPLAAPGRSTSPVQHYSRQSRPGSAPLGQAAGPQGPFTTPAPVGAKKALAEALMPYKAHLRRSGTPMKGAAAAAGAAAGHPSTPDGRRMAPPTAKAGFSTPQQHHQQQQTQMQQRPQVPCAWLPGAEEALGGETAGQQQHRQQVQQARYQQTQQTQQQPWVRSSGGVDVRASVGSQAGRVDMDERQAAMVRQARQRGYLP